MLSEQAQTVFAVMQQRPLWVVRIDSHRGYTFGLGKSDVNEPLANLPIAVLDELLTAGLIQRIKVYRILDGRFTLCTYQMPQNQ